MASRPKSPKVVLNALHVASDPLRARILDLLAKEGPQTNAMLADTLVREQATIAFHTEKLLEAGLIGERILENVRGRKPREYHIVPWRATLSLSEKGLLIESVA